MNLECVFDKQLLKFTIFLLSALIYNGILIGAVLYALEAKEYIDWCSGVGFLIICTSFVYFGFFYKFVVKKLLPVWLRCPNVNRLLSADAAEISAQWKWAPWIFLTILLVSMTLFVALDSKADLNRMIALLGMILILIISVLLSENPSNIRWKTLFSGLCLNICLGLASTRWQLFVDALNCITSLDNAKNTTHSVIILAILMQKLISSIKK